jgi:predicted RNase H-like HicB family nuclease
MKMKSKNILKYDVVFEEAEEGGYTVTVPLLPGCISEGDTFEKAKANIADAITLYLEDMEADGEEIPVDNKSIFIGQVEINRFKPTASF